MKNFALPLLSTLCLILLSCEKKEQADSCIDPNLIDPTVICTADYTPVCGCNGQTYSNACVAKSNGVLRYRPGHCDCSYPYRGTVKDFTGLDGCGLMIVLPSGERLEVQKMPINFLLVPEQTVEFDYKVLNNAGSFCMAGEIVEITCIKDASCLPIKVPTSITQQDVVLPDDVTIISARVVNDCLEINYSYSGGCETHNFELRLQPVYCGTPPHPTPHLVFGHEDNGDACDALILDKLSYDLTPLREDALQSVQFELSNLDRSFNKTFTYNY